jgi:molybdopterin-guanine dinucleotide biosynthesis protein A
VRAIAAVGIFVGGQSRRMGGEPKGLLRIAADGPTIDAGTIALARAITENVWLVGEHDAYAHLGLPMIPDAAPQAGPLGALVALLERVEAGDAIALACDMPHVTEAMLARLATHEPGAVAVAPRSDDRWSPLFARYDAARVLPLARARLASGSRALQALLDAIGASELPLSESERVALHDWDSPEDIR